MAKQLSAEELARLRGFVGPEALEPEPDEYQRPRQQGRPGVESTGLLTPQEVAQVFAVSAKTVTRWSRAGKLPAIRTPGNHRRFKAADVQALAAKGWQPS